MSFISSLFVLESQMFKTRFIFVSTICNITCTLFPNVGGMNWSFWDVWLQASWCRCPCLGRHWSQLWPSQLFWTLKFCGNGPTKNTLEPNQHCDCASNCWDCNVLQSFGPEVGCFGSVDQRHQFQVVLLKQMMQANCRCKSAALHSMFLSWWQHLLLTSSWMHSHLEVRDDAAVAAFSNDGQINVLRCQTAQWKSLRSHHDIHTSRNATSRWFKKNN